MTGGVSSVRSIGYRTGWWILVVISGGSILNHVLGPLSGYAEGDAEVFVFFCLAALNTYALAVLLTSYRRGERWAWWVTWAMIAVYGITFLYASDAGRYYLGAAVVMAIAQLLTWPAFRRSGQAQRAA
jgi:hypothetical protein